MKTARTGTHPHASHRRSSSASAASSTSKVPSSSVGRSANGKHHHAPAATASTAMKSGNGDGKHLNPDAAPALAAPGTVEADRGQMRSDEQLIAAYRAGDRASFAELVGRY